MSRPEELAVPQVNYRCVCGESIVLSLASGGACPTCGRRYSPAALRDGVAETQTIELTPGTTYSSQDPAPTTEDTLLGKTFGHYRIVNRLGHGGMGTVYRALDESLQRYVALKVIRAGNPSAADTRHIQRLLQEAIAQARVTHPNVVHIYFVGREGTSPFFAMELVNGPTLAQRLADGPLPFREIVAIGEQIADALRHAVAFDINHGDIKPSNILLAEGVGVKLSDFGLARRLSQLTSSGSVAGTPNYMAPEIVQGSSPDVRSDLYSLGVTLYEMTFGRLPYVVSGTNLVQWFVEHQTDPVTFPEPWPTTVPRGWEQILARLLSKAPEGRYQSYAELQIDLRKLRPVSAPAANRLPRALAWGTDLFVTNIAQWMIYGPLVAARVAKVFANYPFLDLMIALAGASIPAMVALAQVRWKTTPGKELFQIRIVDQHGLTPGARTLALRSVAQFLPLWINSLEQVASALYLGGPMGLVAGVAMLALLVDIGCALFRGQGRTLHDDLFHTRVVLNTGRPESSS